MTKQGIVFLTKQSENPFPLNRTIVKWWLLSILKKSLMKTASFLWKKDEKNYWGKNEISRGTIKMGGKKNNWGN